MPVRNQGTPFSRIAPFGPSGHAVLPAPMVSDAPPPPSDHPLPPLSAADRALQPHLPVILDLVQQMLRFDPTERITAREALQHPFFQLDLPQEGYLEEAVEHFMREKDREEAVAAAAAAAAVGMEGQGVAGGAGRLAGAQGRGGTHGSLPAANGLSAKPSVVSQGAGS